MASNFKFLTLLIIMINIGLTLFFPQHVFLSNYIYEDDGMGGYVLNSEIQNPDISQEDGILSDTIYTLFDATGTVVGSMFVILNVFFALPGIIGELSGLGVVFRLVVLIPFIVFYFISLIEWMRTGQ